MRMRVGEEGKGQGKDWQCTPMHAIVHVLYSMRARVSMFLDARWVGGDTTMVMYIIEGCGGVPVWVAMDSIDCTMVRWQEGFQCTSEWQC